MVSEDIKSGEMVCLDEVDNKIKKQCAKPMSSSASVNTGAPDPNATAKQPAYKKTSAALDIGMEVMEMNGMWVLTSAKGTPGAIHVGEVIPAGTDACVDVDGKLKTKCAAATAPANEVKWYTVRDTVSAGTSVAVSYDLIMKINDKANAYTAGEDLKEGEKVCIDETDRKVKKQCPAPGQVTHDTVTPKYYKLAVDLAAGAWAMLSTDGVIIAAPVDAPITAKFSMKDSLKAGQQVYLDYNSRVAYTYVDPNTYKPTANTSGKATVALHFDTYAKLDPNMGPGWVPSDAKDPAAIKVCVAIPVNEYVTQYTVSGTQKCLKPQNAPTPNTNDSAAEALLKTGMLARVKTALVANMPAKFNSAGELEPVMDTTKPATGTLVSAVAAAVGDLMCFDGDDAKIKLRDSCKKMTVFPGWTAPVPTTVPVPTQRVKKYNSFAEMNSDICKLDPKKYCRGGQEIDFRDVCANFASLPVEIQ